MTFNRFPCVRRLQNQQIRHRISDKSNIINDLDNSVKVDNATVVVADIEASNGVIHVIDSVILPQS